MIKTIATFGGVQIIGVLATIGKAKMLAVLVGPEGVGIVALIDQLVQFVLFASAISLPIATVRFLARAHSQGSAEFQLGYAGFLQILVTLTGLGALIGLLIVLFQPVWLGLALANYQSLLVPALLAVPLLALHGFFANTLAAAQRGRISSLLLLLINLAMAAAAVIGVLVNRLPGLYWTSLLVAGALVIAVGVYLRRTLNLQPLSPGHGIQAELRRSPDLIGFSLIFYCSSFMVPLAYLTVRHTLLVQGGEFAAGIFQAALALATALSLVVAPANHLFLTPLLNRTGGSAAKMNATFEFQVALLVIMSTLAAPLVLVPHWLLALFYSPAFFAAAELMPPLVVAVCLLQLASSLQALLVGLDDNAAASLVGIVGHASFALGAWALVGQIGLLGASWALLGGGLVMVVTAAARLRQRHGIDLPPRLVGLGLYSLIALLVGGWLGLTQSPWEPLALAIKVLLAAIFVASLLRFLPLADRQSLLRYLTVRA